MLSVALFVLFALFVLVTLFVFARVVLLVVRRENDSGGVGLVRNMNVAYVKTVDFVECSQSKNPQPAFFGFFNH